MKFSASILFAPATLAFNPRLVMEDKIPTAAPVQIAPVPDDNGLSAEPFIREYVGGQYCRAPKNIENEWIPPVCKYHDDGYEQLLRKYEINYYHRNFTEECGPDCRPSCVTLMLDLEKFSYSDTLSCNSGDFCKCKFQKDDECELKTNLFDEYPKCYLEDADCYGPTVYDDSVAMHEFLAFRSGLDDKEIPDTDHCTCIPDDDLYCRFQDWKMVKPMKHNCEKDVPCIDETKIFFEYCNVLEEEDSCRETECSDEKCQRECRKVIEPFPSGWTTFTVSASIPYPTNGINSACDKKLQYEDRTGKACFLQRVEIYYPEQDEDCGLGCPHCHECPLLSLGDKFGPLEVVGFGHGVHESQNRGHHHCVSCDAQNYKECERDTTVDCNDLLYCEKVQDCYNTDAVFIPDFEEQCSFSDNAAASEVINSGSSFTFAGATSGDYSQESSTEDNGATIGASIAGVAGAVLAGLFVSRQYNKRKTSRKSSSQQTRADPETVVVEQKDEEEIEAIHSRKRSWF